MEKNGIEYEAYYFEKKLIEETNETVYVFNKKYWQDRVDKNWSKLVPIFD